MSASVLANLLVAATLVYASALHALAPDFHQQSVQEDEYLEWCSFWLFALAGIGFAKAFAADRRAHGGVPWFLAGVALFCGFVALEEISWGQRLVGARPPTIFLEHNAQLELNFHNVLPDPLRQAGFQAVAIGYGVLLPLAFLHARLRKFASRLGVRAPSARLAPAFLLTSVFYAVYPWSHAGEWAEAMLGASLLFAALLFAEKPRMEEVGHGAGPTGHARAATWIALSWLLACALGVGTAQLGWALAGGDPERIESARVELEALRQDITGARTRTRTHCGLHQRLYALAARDAQQHLMSGDFARLVAGGLPAARAEFFLDPWNSPYWIRHACSADRTQRAIYVYSFGPNRRRDSTTWELVPDDLGAWAIRPEGAEVLTR